MVHTVGLLLTLFGGTALVQAQNISEAAKSPYDLAKFVETHHDFDWEPLWKAFKVNDSEIFLPACEENSGLASCSAELVTLADPAQIILVLEHRDSGFQVLLRFRKASTDAWRFSGAFSPRVKYFPLEHHVTRLGSKPFFITTSQGISGTGVSAKIERWFDLAKEQFEPVLSFTSEGNYSPFPEGIGRETRGKIISGAVRPEERLTVFYHVQFEAVGADGNEVPIVSRTDTVVYVRKGSGDFGEDERLSTATAHEVEIFYDVKEIAYSDEQFLKFNFKELSEVAATKGDQRLGWLSKFLQNAPDIPEAGQLKALMATQR